MELLLTILSVLAVWTVLALLTVSLMLIRQPLKRARIHLERIAMGVRAIEQQVTPLGDRAKRLVDLLEEASRGTGDAAVRLRALDRSLKTTIENEQLG